MVRKQYSYANMRRHPALDNGRRESSLCWGSCTELAVETMARHMDREDHLHQTTMKSTRMRNTTTESLMKPTGQISNTTVRSEHIQGIITNWNAEYVRQAESARVNNCPLCGLALCQTCSVGCSSYTPWIYFCSSNPLNPVIWRTVHTLTEKH